MTVHEWRAWAGPSRSMGPEDVVPFDSAEEAAAWLRAEVESFVWDPAFGPLMDDLMCDPLVLPVLRFVPVGGDMWEFGLEPLLDWET